MDSYTSYTVFAVREAINTDREIQKLKKRLIYFTAIGSITGCALGSVLGYIVGTENAQKVSEQKTVLKLQQPQKTIDE